MSCGLFIHDTIISHINREKRATLKNFTLTLYHVLTEQNEQDSKTTIPLCHRLSSQK